jgi:hypothetical protein
VKVGVTARVGRELVAEDEERSNRKEQYLILTAGNIRPVKTRQGVPYHSDYNHYLSSPSMP